MLLSPADFDYIPNPDYLPVNSTLTILSGTPSGSTSCTTVTIVDDEVLENQEQFFLDLTSLSPNFVTVAPNLGTKTVYITDNERKPKSQQLKLAKRCQ